jgi:aminodeoxyfutalosine synthase
MTTAQLVTLIKQAKRIPVERDTLYNEIKNYGDVDVEDVGMSSSFN